MDLAPTVDGISSPSRTERDHSYLTRYVTGVLTTTFGPKPDQVDALPVPTAYRHKCPSNNGVLFGFDSEGFYKADTALYGYRGSPRFWKAAVAEAAKALGLKPSKIRNFLQYVHVDG